MQIILTSARRDLTLLPNESAGRSPQAESWRHCAVLLAVILSLLARIAAADDRGDANLPLPATPALPVSFPWSPTLRTSIQTMNDELMLANQELALVTATARRDENQVLTEAAEKAQTDPIALEEPALPASEAVQLAQSEESATPRRLRYHVGLTVRGVFDDNINISQTNREEDFYTTIEAMINLGFGSPEGNYIALTYSPNAYIFADHSENNALQHLLTLTGQYRFPRLTLSLTQDVQILDGTGLNSPTGIGTDFTRTNLDVAGRTRLNIYTTRVDANYSLTGKTFLTGGLNYSVSDYDTLISSSVISANVYFNYTYSPKLSIGLGVVGGYDAVDAPSDDQTFEQLNVRASYELTGKVSATISAGVEFRQVANSDATDNGSPVFDATLFYQPFDGTSLALTFSRRTLNSATLAAQDFHSTSVIFSARQRFLQRIFMGLSVGYENSSYFSTTSGIDSNRSDDYYFAQVSLDLNVTNFWTVGVYYFYRESDSSFDAFSFYDNQFGLRTSVQF